MPKKWLICAARPYLTDHMLHCVHSPHPYYITFTKSWKPIQIRRRNIRNLKSYTMWIKAQKVIQWCMQCKWGFAIQMSQHKIFYAKKVTHLCCHSSSHWSYASFCTFSSSILHDFYGILETDSNLMQKYKKSEKLYNADWGIKSHMQCKWGFAIQMSQNKIFSCNYDKKSDSFLLPGLICLIICFILYTHLIDIT